MPLWQDEYLAALRERDKKEKANVAFYASYAKLADRTAALQTQSTVAADHYTSQAPSSNVQEKRPAQSSISGSPPPASTDIIGKLRRDLSEAQRSRGLLESKLKSVGNELGRLRIQSSLDDKHIIELTRERDQLSRSVKDRDEEIRGKAKLLEDLHDETVSLTLQLNMADERAKRLEIENHDLVERWMKRMGEEADQMNEKSKFT